MAGGRDFRDFHAMEAHFRQFVQRFGEPQCIVSGMATGADTLACKLAWVNDLELVPMPADWAKHGSAAGPIRNKAMARIGTHLLAFWDGQSPGTRHMIEEARSCGLPTRVVRYGER